MGTSILIGAAIVVLAVVIIIAARRAEKARVEGLQQAAAAAGFTFETEGDLERIKALGDLPLYGRGHSRRVKNVLSGRSGNADVTVFDYRYTVGRGKQSHTSDQTIALYPGTGRALPDFQMAPENLFFDKLNQVLGYQDIDFDSNPEFSSRYILRGPDEHAIRSAFSGDMQSFLAAHEGWTVETQAGTVAIYRAAQRVKPEGLSDFLEQSRAVLTALARG